MAREHTVLSEENFPIPAGAFTFEGFRRWVESDEFPESGRIDFLAGDVEVDLSPEELFTHNLVKMAIGSGLHALITDRDLGEAFADRARVSSPQAGLSVEPDVVVVLGESFQEGRVRYPPSDRSPDRFLEIEGAPDLVVEVVSDSSVHKDTRLLPELYARAGVPELWIADAAAASFSSGPIPCGRAGTSWSIPTWRGGSGLPGWAWPALLVAAAPCRPGGIRWSTRTPDPTIPALRRGPEGAALVAP